MLTGVIKQLKNITFPRVFLITPFTTFLVALLFGEIGT